MEAMNIDDDSYIYRLQDVRKEEDSLIDRLIKERLYLAQYSRIDHLTGLYTRKILSKVREVGTAVLCDVDDFKDFNDQFGHSVGDDVLRAVSRVISDNIRVGDIGCRFGGDEFLILFTTDNHNVIDARIRKIAEEVRKSVQLPGKEITMSIGIAFNEGEKTIATLADRDEILASIIECADKAMYESKENGKNQISYYDKQKAYQYRRREDLRPAINS